VAPDSGVVGGALLSAPDELEEEIEIPGRAPGRADGRSFYCAAAPGSHPRFTAGTAVHLLVDGVVLVGAKNCTTFAFSAP
jgi:hypothetical protein